MTQLTAVIAGGVIEASKYLNLQIQHARSAMNLCGGLAFVIFLSLFGKAYQSHQEMKRQNAIKDLLESIK